MFVVQFLYKKDTVGALICLCSGFVLCEIPAKLFCRYGLILSQKSASKSVPISRPSIFGDDSDDEVIKPTLFLPSYIALIQYPDCA